MAPSTWTLVGRPFGSPLTCEADPASSCAAQPYPFMMSLPPRLPKFTVNELKDILDSGLWSSRDKGSRLSVRVV